MMAKITTLCSDLTEEKRGRQITLKQIRWMTKERGATTRGGPTVELQLHDLSWLQRNVAGTPSSYVMARRDSRRLQEGKTMPE